MSKKKSKRVARPATIIVPPRAATGGVMDLGAVSLGDHQFDTVNFNPTDPAGNPVAVVIVGSADDPTLVTVVVASDNKSATINSLGKLGGPTTVTFSGTNPDGTPVPDNATVEVTIVAEDAGGLGATLGTPQEEQ